MLLGSSLESFVPHWHPLYHTIRLTFLFRTSTHENLALAEVMLSVDMIGRYYILWCIFRQWSTSPTLAITWLPLFSLFVIYMTLGTFRVVWP